MIHASLGATKCAMCVNRWVHSEEGLDDSYEPADRWHDGGHVLIPPERGMGDTSWSEHQTCPQ